MFRFSLLLSLLNLLYLNVASQGIKPVIQTGHSQRILFYSVNYNNNLLLTSDKNELILWNTLSGKQLRRIASPFTIRGAAFCSNGEEITVLSYEYGKDAALRIYNSRTGDLLNVISFSEKNSWGSISYKPMDELITDQKNNRVAVRSFDEITIVDIPERKKLHHFKLNAYNNKLAFTSNPAMFMNTWQENEDLKLSLIDTAGNILQTVNVASARKQAGLINNEEQNLFYLLDDKAEVHLYDMQLKLLDVIKSDSISSVSSLSPPTMAVSKDGKKLLLPLHKSQYLYNLDKKQWLNNNWKWINTSTALLFADEDATKVVKVSDQLPYILDTDTGDEIFLLSSKVVESNNVRFSPSGRMMSTFHSSLAHKSTSILDFKTGMQFNEAEIDYAIFQWITDSVVLCAPYEEYDSNTGEFIHSLQVRNIYNGIIQHKISVSKIRFNIDYATISSDKKKIAFLTSDQMYLFTGNNFKKKTIYNLPENAGAKEVYFTPDSKKLILPSNIIRIYNLENNKWLNLKDTANYSYSHIAITPDSKEIWYEDYKKMPSDGILSYENKPVISVYNIETGKTVIRRIADTLISYVQVHPAKDMYAIGFFNGTVELRRRSDDSLLFRAKEQSGVVNEIAFEPNNKWMISKGYEGLFKFRNISNNEHVITVAALYQVGERGFAMITPDNYYLLPSLMINGLHYAKEFDTYSFAQLDLQLNRPDKVLEKLGMADESLLDIHRKAFIRRLHKAGYTETMLPDITSVKPLRITNRKAIKNVTTNSLITLQLQTAQELSSIKEINVYVNGQKIDEHKKNKIQWSIPIELSVGKNNIEAAYVTNSGMESLRERLEVSYAPDIPVQTKTYYIGVAVSHYQDSTMNLKYAVKDVTDIAAKFKQKDSTANVFLFTNNEVTKQNLSSIKKILSQTSVNDKVVISFSGHGMLDTAYAFYFAGYDMNFSEPSVAGISFNDINSLLDDIPARKKLVLIDACHSGEVDRDVFTFSSASKDTQFVKEYKRSSIKIKNRNSLQNTVKLMEQYFTDINRNNGANIISAAAGEEYALESPQWNNGVFSYSFIKGLFEKEADADRNGKVSQSEIRKYMQRLVLKLTKGKQQPTSRSINSDFDWEF